MTMSDNLGRERLLRRGFTLEYLTLGWNVAGIVVLAVAAVAARSVALAGFGLDSLIEIGASVVVIWELSGTGEDRQQRGLRLIGCAFGGGGRTRQPATYWSTTPPARSARSSSRPGTELLRRC